MSDLDRMTKALRDSASPNPREAEETRARIEKTLRARRVVAIRWKRYVVLPMAAVLLVGTAWAGASGGIAKLFSQKEDETPVTSAVERKANVNADANANVNADADVSVNMNVNADADVSVNMNADVVSEKPIAPVDADALYRKAHELHFVSHDYAQAIPAWDRYLAAAGAGGRFVVEARYNRAIALVRVRRNDEARRALDPFANGDYGGYRRDDAQRLIDSLK